MITGQDADASVVAQLEQDLRQVLDYYETVLAEREWLAGSVCTIQTVYWVNRSLCLTTELQSN